MQESDVKELFSAIKMLKDKVEKIEQEHLTRIEELEKQIKELQKNRTKTRKEMSPEEEFEADKEKFGWLQTSGKLSEKRPSEVKNNKVSDPYSKENFIDRGGYYELVIPIGTIRMIEKPLKVERRYDLAKNYHKKCSAGGFSDWRLPTIDELEMIFQANPFQRVYGEFLSSSSCYDDDLGDSTYYYEREDYIDDDSTNRACAWDSYKVFCVR